MKINLLISLFVLIPFFAISQDSEPIVSSRPGQAFVPNILEEGRFQLQSGIGFFSSDLGLSGIAKSENFVHNSLLRFGLSKKVELRTSLTLTKGRFSSDQFSDFNTFGVNDFELGFRYNILGGEERASKLSFQTAVGLPVRPGDFNTESVSYDLLFIYSRPLSKKLTLTTNIGLETADIRTGPIAKYVLNVSFPLTESLSAFVENYGTYTRSGFNVFDTFFDGGFALLVNNNLQLDLSAGYASNSFGNVITVSQWFVDGGVSIRFK